ncbi:hypothetical protein VZT92_018430 [Zoarces viviparus]|uniref:Uncharacterized protein n=1 Tax=Zoarces viviparus TaxID=48416 RepID=A0AAW1EHW4_ZOAVI
MFWKNTAWSWDDAADNDDGGYLLVPDLRRTPYSTSDTDLNHIPTNKTTTAAATTNLNHITTTGLKVLTNHSLDPTSSSYVSTLCVDINRRQATQQLPVSPPPLSHIQRYRLQQHKGH